MGSRAPLFWALLVASSACSSTPRGARPLPLEVGGDHFVGTVHTGPRAVETLPAASTGEPWWIEARFAYAAAPPAAGAEPLAARTRQVFAGRGAEPLKPLSDLALGVLCASSAASPVPDLRSVSRIDPLWPGTTTVWRLQRRLDGEVEDWPAAAWDLLEIQLSRPEAEPGSAELALVFEGRVLAHVAAEEAEKTRNPEPVLEREHLVLAGDPIAGDEPFRVFLPAPSRRFPSGGFEIEIARTSPAPGDELATVLERGRSALFLSIARSRGASSPVTGEEGFHFESGSALPALEDPKLRRGALAFLAQMSGASLAGDLAIDAGPEALASFAPALAERLRGKSGGERGPASLGWALESCAYGWLAARALDEKHPPAPELQALLLVHAGELGRFPDMLRDAVQECDGLAALERRLVEENRIFLEDSDPGSRLRAFEWLRDRGAAPEAFDPLAPAAERRAALDRARPPVENGGENGGAR